MLLEFRDRGFVKSVIAITHDLSILAQIADSILVMYAGRLAEKADTDTIVECSAASLHPDAAGLAARGRASAMTRRDAYRHPGPPAVAVNPPPGCRFADRCPFARDKCAEAPAFEEVQPGPPRRLLEGQGQGWPRSRA